MSEGRILAIDDELNVRRLIENEFALEGFEVKTAGDGEEGLRIFEEEAFDLVLLDIKLPKMDGIQVLDNLKRTSPSVAVIMITAYGDVCTAVQSMKLGAYDYITKPFKLSELISLVKRVIHNGRETVKPRTASLSGREGRPKDCFVPCPNPSMQEVYALMGKVAPTDKTVLIQGETGVGKDKLAFQIHQSSRRKDAPFVIVDCGLLTQGLIESELYGHCKGAFSGAAEKKTGLVESGHGGTLFLNEIGNVDIEMQRKLLHFLETRRFRRLGETKEIHVDARIILATNMDLGEALQKGVMRKDLFYRMDFISLHVPPLKRHPECIAPLVRHFLKLDRIPSGPERVGREAMEALCRYPWPGNVRELRSVINKAMILCETDTITLQDLPSQVLARNKAFCAPKTLEDVEKEHIMRVLEQTGGNQSKAAEILGINRKTLYKKLHKHRLFT